MCYSDQVIQRVRKLHRQLGIRLDSDEAERLFMRRLDDPSLNISRGFELNFYEPTTDQGRRIKAAIDEHYVRVAAKLEKDSVYAEDAFGKCRAFTQNQGNQEGKRRRSDCHQ